LDGFDWDFDSAGKEFRRAIELNPGYATAHHWYAWHLSLLGRYDEAIPEMRKALNLGPLSLIINADLAELLVLAHAYDESIKQSRKTIEMDPNFPTTHSFLGRAYEAKGMYDHAVAEYLKFPGPRAFSPDTMTCIRSGVEPIRLVGLAIRLGVLFVVASSRLFSGERQRRTLPEPLQRLSARPMSQRLIGLASPDWPMPWRPCVSDHEPERLDEATKCLARVGHAAPVVDRKRRRVGVA